MLLCTYSATESVSSVRIEDRDAVPLDVAIQDKCGKRYVGKHTNLIYWPHLHAFLGNWSVWLSYLQLWER